MRTYDAVVIGAGPGGSAAAQQVTLRGGRACMIDVGPLGGTCLNVGCMPTKALLGSSGRYWDMKNTEDLAIEPAEVSRPDTGRIMRRVSEFVRDLRHATQQKIASNENLDLIRGRARIVDPETVAVETEDGEIEVFGTHLVIATGSSPRRPAIFDWSDPGIINSDQAIQMDSLPQSVLVIGGGPIGCEFATAYGELGVRTRLIEAADRLLGRYSEDVSDVAANSLRRRGVELALGHNVQKVCRKGDDIRVEFEDSQGMQAQVVMVAVGRRPNLDDIGLENLNVEMAGNVISVDERCRTSEKHVYAVGDAAEKRQHSHLAVRMGVVAGDQIMGCDTTDDRKVVVQGTYTHPEIACVGCCGEDRCPPAESAVQLRRDFADSGSARAFGRTEGFVKVVVHRETHRILGGTWAGVHAVEMIHEIALAIRHELTLEDIYHTIHAHPGFQESLHALAENFLEPRLGSCQ
ncbi:MAG: dihydrolipoyl dehydrogenase family protein [Phycisphaerae bacterium]